VKAAKRLCVAQRIRVAELKRVPPLPHGPDPAMEGVMTRLVLKFGGTSMRKAGIDPAKLKEKSEFDVLPRSVRQIADNHNHLHEQPVIFYALVTYSHLVGVGDAINIGFAWSYVILRVIHSLVQSTVNFIPLRFAIYALATICLFVIAIRNLIALPV